MPRRTRQKDRSGAWKDVFAASATDVAMTNFVRKSRQASPGCHQRPVAGKRATGMSKWGILPLIKGLLCGRCPLVSTHTATRPLTAPPTRGSSTNPFPRLSCQVSSIVLCSWAASQTGAPTLSWCRPCTSGFLSIQASGPRGELLFSSTFQACSRAGSATAFPPCPYCRSSC